MNVNERFTEPGRCKNCQRWAQLNSASNCEPCARVYHGETLTQKTQPAVADAGRDTRTVSSDPIALPEAPPGYTLIDEIGQGGMGIVFRALERGSSRVVAIKYMSTRMHRTSRERFEREVKALASLNHPALVPIFAVNLEARDPYFMMEFLPGGSLSRRLRRGPVAQEEAAQLMSRVARGVAAAHAAGILHRDLKPSNILLDDFDQPRVADFGLAKLIDHPEQQELTRTQSLIGTPNYMAPEQADRRHRDVDQRADVYALGATLYECLTGRPPFDAESVEETLAQVRTSFPILPSAIVPGIAPDMEAICLHCLEKRPGMRYPSADALADDLDRWLKGLPTVARPDGVRDKLWRVLQHNRAKFSAVVACVFFLVLLSQVDLLGTRPTTAQPQKRSSNPAANSASSRVDQVEAVVPPLVPAPQFAPDRDEQSVRRLLRNHDTVELVDERGPRVPLIQGFGSAQLVRSPNQDTALSLFTRDHCVLLLLNDPGIDRYRLQMEVRHDLKMRDLEAEWPSRYASVGFALACTLSSTPDGIALFSLNMIGMSDQGLSEAETGDLGSIQVEELVLATNPLKNSRSAGHTLHRLSLSELQPGTKTRPWRYFQVDVSPEGITLQSEDQKLFKSAAELRRGVRWQDLLPSQTREKLTAGNIHPGWNTRSPIGIWCRGSWASIRRVIIGPLP